MALIKCYECEKEISDKAPACPHCGAPRREDHKWASISAGIHHTVGITTSGDAYAWGWNDCGRLGDGTTQYPGLPMPDEKCTIPGLVSGGHKWASVSAGRDHTVGITTSGYAYAWGDDLFGAYYDQRGALGNDRTTGCSAIPELVSGSYKWASISAGRGYTAGITAGAASSYAPQQDRGNVYAWGCNDYGQLGIGGTRHPPGPSRITFKSILIRRSGGHKWASISVGIVHTTGITTRGAAYAWGRNNFGQLGDGTTTDRSTPGLVSGGHKWASISADGYHTVGITTSGDAYAWGDNEDGQLGDGTTTGRSTPGLVSGGHKWASVSAGVGHTAGITTSGVAYAWGTNWKGQLGDGTTTDRSTPTLVSSRP